MTTDQTRSLPLHRTGAIPALVLAAAVAATPLQARADPAYASREAFGRALFFDTDLSRNRTQACATCHDPNHGFADPREAGAGGAVSLGDDGVSIGGRNAPTAAYAALAPVFGTDPASGLPRGGFFHDGRAATLEDQAGGPPLNPLEMGMADADAVVARLREKADYVRALDTLFGPGTAGDVDRSYRAMEEAIAAYERTAEFAPFDSRYDRSLRGEVALTEREELGRVLFFSNQFTNCSQCHRSRSFGGVAGEPFTNHRFHNIGVPANPALPGPADPGLAANPAAPAGGEGRFKVPSLRNVAVTGPYMHNGVFRDLRTVVAFYNTYNVAHPERLVNPETGAPFGAPEQPANLSLAELRSGPALDDRRIDALVAFLRALTDRRYEALLPPE